MKTLLFSLLAFLPLSIFAQSPITEPVTTSSVFPANAISLASYKAEEETPAAKATVAENTALSSAITIFPNPAKSLCTIGVSNKEFSNFSYVILDQYDYEITSGQGTSTLNVSQLTPGTYTVKVQVGESVGYKQLTVKGKE